MTTNAVSSAYTGASTTQSGLDKQTLIGDFDTFLNLLIAQLKNQDPLSPMESTEFTNQLVQFAGVEQSIKTNKNLEDLLGLTVANRAALVTNYLNQWVEAPTDAIALQDGKAMFTYNLPKQASSVSIRIEDLEKNTVLTFTGATSQGLHKVIWEGYDDSGYLKDDGAYRVVITARDEKGDRMYAQDGNGNTLKDANGNPVSLIPNTVGRVTAYNTEANGGTLVVMGDSAVDLNDVVGVFLERPEKDAQRVGSKPKSPEPDPDPENPEEPEDPDPPETP